MVPLDHGEVARRIGARFYGPPPQRPLRGIRGSDREEAGDLFVAVRGAAYDSHAAIPSLPARGVRAVVAEMPPPDGYPLPYYQVENSRRALAILEHAAAGDPALGLRVFGVTGTNGKSTTVRLLAAILEAAGGRVGWMSTVTQRLGAGEAPQALTTPEPRELAQGMAALVRSGGTDVVLEVSSHALAQERVSGLEFSGAILTNLGRDHLDYHGTTEEYLRAKLTLFARVKPGAPAVFPLAGPVAPSAPELAGTRPLRFGRDAAADAYPHAVVFEPDGTRGSLVLAGERVPFRSPLVGRHNLENILAAALLARAAGVAALAIAEGIRAAPPVRGRLEPVPGGRGRIFVDYAHTPDALEAVLRASRELTSAGRLHVLFGCGGDRDRGKRPEMGAVAERLADRVWVTCDNPRSEEPRSIVEQILAGMAEPRRARVELDRRAAIAGALSALEPGDTLVVAGKGHEREQQIGRERFPFDDRSVIEEILAKGSR